LWYVVDTWRAPAEADDDAISFEHCLQDAFVDCVEFEPPAKPAPAPEAAAAPCKAWLSDDGGLAALSRCLSEARRVRDAVRIQNFERAQRIAASR
jgi:hypothetical protein